MGTRLRPLTLRVPKPLVPYGNVPLIHHAWAACRALGIRDFAINTHYLPQFWQDPQWGVGCDEWQFASEQGANGEPVMLGHLQGTTIRLFHEPTLLETGGGLRNVRQWMGNDTVLVHNGDIFSTMPLERLAAAHEASGLPVTLALRSQGDAKHIAMEGDRVVDIRGKLGKADGTHVFSGIYCMNASLFDDLPEQEVVSVIPAFLELASRGQIGCVVLDEGEWFDLGERESYLIAHQRWLEHAPIHPNAVIAADAIVERSVIGAGAVVSTGAVIRDSVLWPGARVRAGASVERCIVFSDKEVSGSHREEDL